MKTSTRFWARVLFWIGLLALFFFCKTELAAQSFRGDDMQNMPGRPGEWILRGNVQIVSQGNRIYSDYAEYNQKTSSCVAYGHLRIITNQNVRITGERLVYDGQKLSYKVIDNVVMNDGSVEMRTPEMDFDGRTNNAKYTKGGTITTGESVLTSLLGNYVSGTQILYCYREVVIVNPDYTIWTDTLHYNRSGLAHFFGPTNIETKDYFMFSKMGWFNQNTEAVSLKEDASIKNKESQILYGDSIYYELGKKWGNVHRNVFLLDSARNCFVKSHYAENNENEGFAFFTWKPRGVYVQGENGEDSLFFSADSIVLCYSAEGEGAAAAGGSTRTAGSSWTAGGTASVGAGAERGAKTSGTAGGSAGGGAAQDAQKADAASGSDQKRLDRLEAYHNAKFFREDMQGVCDSLIYIEKDSIMYLLNEPIVWVNNFQCDGDSIRVWFSGNDIKRARLNYNAFIAGRAVDSSENTPYEDWFNQVMANEIWAYFADSSKLDYVEILGNPETIYYVIDEEKNEITGVNKANCKQINIYFKDGQMDGASLIEPQNACLYPNSSLEKKDRFLKRFHFEEEKRPKSKWDLSKDW